MSAETYRGREIEIEIGASRRAERMARKAARRVVDAEIEAADVARIIANPEEGRTPMAGAWIVLPWYITLYRLWRRGAIGRWWRGHGEEA